MWVGSVFLFIWWSKAGADISKWISIRSPRDWHQINSDLRCKEELTLNQVPSFCYASAGMNPDIQAFLDRRCQRAVNEVHDLKRVIELLEDGRLSSTCLSFLKRRGEILAYKREDSQPVVTYIYLSKSADGPNLERQSAHAQRTLPQSN